MLLEIVLASAIAGNSPQATASNTLPSPSGQARWPGEERSPFRWVLDAPLEKRPFVVAWSGSWNYQIAVRYAFDPAEKAEDRVYFVAMRQTPDRLEEADSRECGFKQNLIDLRSLPLPEIVVPGTMPLQAPAHPFIAHRTSSITLFGATQSGGEHADLTLTSPAGDIATWVQGLYEATRDCWKPMTPPV